MGKRNTVVVISSSDDEGKEFSPNRSSFSCAKSKVKSALTPRTHPKRAKRSRLSSSCSWSCEASNSFDEVKRFCEDFDDGFTGFKVSAGLGRSNKDLWVDKYKPHSLAELAVHKKKVEEVKSWFEERLRTTGGELCNHVILITGQAGVGKSATVHVIASHIGATVCEWNTPTPTIWGEHLHNSNSGIRYTSKLDEFENFVERTRKYGLIPSSFGGVCQTSVILLIDDLPVVNGKVAYTRLHNCLHRLLRSVCIPTAILITDYGKADSEDQTTRFFEELQLSLQNAGAYKVAFNPITDNSIKKPLSKICREEQLKMTPEQIDLIVKASGGDIRHAITTLQYFCLDPRPMLSSFTNGSPATPNETSDEINHLDHGLSLSFGRDETLSLFHALGKFLHNKRETENTITSEKQPILLREKFSRLPLKMESPEKVLSQVHGQTRTIVDFLHENVLDFLCEEAIDDAWIVTSYLSDTDFLLASLSGMLTRKYEAENVIHSAAASISVRGVMFGNSHPSPLRWHSIRRPKLWQVEQSLWHNKREIVSQKSAAYNGLKLPNLSVICTECKPLPKWLEFRESKVFEDQQVLMDSNMVEDENSGIMSLDEKGIETSDEEIEDW